MFFTGMCLFMFQFVEIKGSVFKKFEKNNLFQMSNSGESQNQPSYGLN